MKLTIEVPEALAEAIAEKVAALLVEQTETPATTPAPSERLLTVAEAAEYLRARPQRVYDLVSQKRLSAERDGKRVLIRKAILDRYLAGSR